MLNGLVAASSGTCTQGNAGGMIGISLSVPLYLMAAYGLTRVRRGALIATIAVCSPALLLMLWQGVFAIKLAYGIFVRGVSLCAVREGMSYPMDGREVSVTLLWVGVALGAVVLIGILVRSVFKRGHSE